MADPRNPFILGPRIARPYFCDRIEEQKRLTEAVINGRNLVLISPRRMGKTSLVHVSINESDEIKEEYNTFFLDILQTNSLAEFTFILGKTVFEQMKGKSETGLKTFLAALKSLKGTFGFDPFTGTPTFNIQIGDIKQPEFTLEEIFGFLEQSVKRTVVVIDEFQQITKYPEKNVEAILRAYIQHMANSSFIFAGSERTTLQEMFVDSKRPFYNSSEIMHLGPIKEDIYADFAMRLFSERDKTLEAEAVAWAFSLFDGNTFYLQRTMNGAFADTSRGDAATKETAVRTVKAMMTANEVIYREMLSNISIAQKSVLCAVAKDRKAVNPTSAAFIKRHSLPSASSVQNALVKLIKSGIISKSEGEYSVTDPLLRIFINQLYSIPEF